MGRIAVIKPDHLGDLVLARPAIHAVERDNDIVLHVASTSVDLAHLLFSGIEVRSIDFPHLARRPVSTLDFDKLTKDLAAFDRVLILRDDEIMRTLAAALQGRTLLAAGDHFTHDTRIHQRALEVEFPAYSRTQLFASQPIFWPASIQSVGLCVAAGFPTNRWPIHYWYELALWLERNGISFKLIGGPDERESLSLLSTMLGAIPHRVVRGGIGFANFFDELAELDLIVASDGGTAHICSLLKPILSIFGGSPWRRYAPFGFSNVVMTRDLVCSPCLQFSRTEVNGCLTRECMVNITPKDVFRVIVSNGLDFSAVRQAEVYRGASHLENRPD